MFKIGNEFYLTGLLGLCQLSIKRVASTTGKELSGSYLSLWESWLHSSVTPTPVLPRMQALTSASVPVHHKQKVQLV